jgi:putative transposase
VIAAERGLARRSLERWLWRYRRRGLAGLARFRRAPTAPADLPEDLVALVEGLALGRPPPSLAQIHRQVARLAGERGVLPPSYASAPAKGR